MFEFMSNAFYALVGVVCISLAATILTAVVSGIVNMFRKQKRGGKGNAT